jgi:hypothetical protein
MPEPTNDTVFGPALLRTTLTLALLGLGLYFSVLLVRGLFGYLRFRRVRPTAVVTWPVGRPRSFRLLLGLGVLGAVLSVLPGYLTRPLYHVFGLGVMALYFIFMVPLATRIHLGLYRDGVWAEAGFLPYADIGRMAFHEEPDIVLFLLPRGRSAPFRLPVPRAEYGTVRKVLEEKIRERVVNVERGILGL